MAFEKTMTTDNGVEVKYHRVEEIKILADGISCIAVVGSYKDFDHRCRVFYPVLREEYIFQRHTDNPFEDVYPELKKQDKWKDAKDI